MSDQSAPWLRKVDHRLRALWERTGEPDRPQHRVRVLMRFAGRDQSLKELGAQVHSVAGDIASGTIALNDLPRIASSAEVIFVELAQILARDA